jgi:hypothetical protein
MNPTPMSELPEKVAHQQTSALCLSLATLGTASATLLAAEETLAKLPPATE